MATPLYMLSGPTASGKTEVAHRIAAERGWRLLSVDSMMVYRGMDIGTAKPTLEERQRFDYAGLDLVDPGEPFSVVAWLNAVHKQLDERPTLAVGGTGLYFQALVYGLETGPKGRTEESDVDVLRASLQAINPEVLTRLADPWNPRRLARALTWLEAGKDLPQSWQDQEGFPVPILAWPRDDLNSRIAQRAQIMFDSGLLEECQGLKDTLTGTAGQAIGYQEALAVLKGAMSHSQAVEAITIRTRQYAKRQRTWFRNKMQAEWVKRSAEMSAEKVAEAVCKVWDETGPFMLTELDG